MWYRATKRLRGCELRDYYTGHLKVSTMHQGNATGMHVDERKNKIEDDQSLSGNNLQHRTVEWSFNQTLTPSSAPP